MYEPADNADKSSISYGAVPPVTVNSAEPKSPLHNASVTETDASRELPEIETTCEIPFTSYSPEDSSPEEYSTSIE